MWWLRWNGEGDRRELATSLILDDAATILSNDINVLVLWNIVGRYPADIGDDPRPETAVRRWMRPGALWMR